MESEWRMNVTKWGIILENHVGGTWWYTLAAEMLDFPGFIIAQLCHTPLTEGAILQLNLGTGAYDYYSPWNPGPPNNHFPYGFRVPPDR